MTARATIPNREDVSDDTPPEVMARICYDFISPAFGGTRIVGSVESRRLSIAQSTVATLNEWYGEGSHWVEALNWTWEERHEQ